MDQGFTYKELSHYQVPVSYVRDVIQRLVDV
jgi:hypothetical protein